MNRPRALLKWLMLVTLAATVLGCLRIDSFFYFSPTKVASYQLGNCAQCPPADVNSFLPDSAVNFLEVSFTTTEGSTLYGYLLRHSPPATTTVLYCHGNYYNLDPYWPRAKLLYLAGADVLIYDYEGYGKSDGEPSETGLKRDGIAAMDFLVKTQSVPIGQIALYGYSLGSVPAVWAASHYSNADQIKALILEAPVGSAALFVQNATDLPIPANTVTDLVVDNAELVKSVRLPYFWLQGDRDDTVRYDTHGQAVFDNYAGTTKFKQIVSGANHINIPEVLEATYGGTHYSVYVGLVASFLADPTRQP